MQSRAIGITSKARLQPIQSLSNGGKRFPIQFVSASRKMPQPIDLSASSLDVGEAFRVGHSVDVFSELDHGRCVHMSAFIDLAESFSNWSADHSGIDDLGQAFLQEMNARRGRTVVQPESALEDATVAVELHRRCVSVTAEGSVSCRFKPQAVGTRSQQFLPAISAPGTCLYGLLALWVVAF